MATSDIQVETLRQEYLKLGCGVTVGVDPSIIPLTNSEDTSRFQQSIQTIQH